MHADVDTAVHTIAGRLDATAQKRDQSILFLDCFEQLAQLLLIGKFNGRGHLRRAFHVNLALAAIAENRRIAQQKRVTGEPAVLLAVMFHLGAKVCAHRFERPAHVVTVEMGGDLIEIVLPERTLGAHQLVAGDPAGGDKHYEHAAIGKQQESNVFDDAASQWRRNKNTETAGNGCQNMACALHYCLGRLGCFELAADPLAVFHAGRRLRRNLLDEESVRRRRGHPTCRGVRLV